MNTEKQKTILLVEDDVIITMTEKAILEKYGYRVLTVLNGEAAVAAAEQNPAIDLILMDIDLGKGMDGTEAAAIILKDRDLPVVFLTSHTEPEVVAKTEKITSYGYVVKNSSNTVLNASIKMAFKLFEAKIREKEKEKVLQDIIDKNPLSIQIVDKEGFTLKINPAHTLLFGAVPPADFSIFDDLQLKQKGFGGLIERIKNGEIVHFPLIRYNAHDSIPDVPDVPVWIRTVVFPIHDSSGKTENFIFMHENITKSKEAEEALRASEEKFRLLVENINDVLYTLDASGRITYISPVIERISGRKPADFLGRSFSEFVHPDDLPVLAEKFKQTLGGAREFFEFRVMNGNQVHHVRTSSQRLLSNGVVSGLNGLMSDITEENRAEFQREAALQELQEAKALFEAVVESVPLMIFLKEAKDLRFVIFNRAGEELLGYDRKALLGKNNLDLFPPEQAAHFMAKDREVLDGEAGILDIPEEPILTAGKGTRLLHTRKVCIRGADGTTKYLLGISEDITERKEAEKEIEKQLAEKEILLKEIHHRIKNNIASISGLISLRLQSVTNSEAVAVLRDAIARVDSMRVLYDKLLLSEDYKDISVKKYLDDLINTIIAIFPDKAKIKFDKQISDFQLDPKRLFPLGLIINELITNKMKYAFIGRDAGKITISLTTVDKHVKLFVEDDGNGLPEGFDIKESKGFGLMLVKMLSQQLGGSFSMEKHEGTRCTVEFNK